MSAELIYTIICGAAVAAVAVSVDLATRTGNRDAKRFATTFERVKARLEEHEQ